MAMLERHATAAHSGSFSRLLGRHVEYTQKANYKSESKEWKNKTVALVKVKWCIMLLLANSSHSVTCHMGSHSVTCHLIQVKAPRLNPKQPAAGTRFTYPARMEAELTLVLVICRVWFRPTCLHPSMLVGNHSISTRSGVVRTTSRS